jgi:aryl-alcohol dehydrogenase-like predicted oxidoreductase
MKFLEIAKQKNLARPVSIQNNYSLLTRSFDHSLSEISMREDI